MRKPVTIAVTLLVGALSGAVASLSFKPAERAPRLEQAQGDSQQDEGVTAALQANERRIRVLEQGMLDAKRSTFVPPDEQAAAQANAEAVQEPPGMPTDPAEIERLRQEMYQQWEDSLEYHHKQAVAPSFAGPASQTLSDALATASDTLGFALVGVDCRTQSCEATLKYPSYAAALRDPQATLMLPEGLNCATKIVLPPPADMEEPYTAKVLYDECKLSSDT